MCSVATSPQMLGPSMTSLMLASDSNACSTRLLMLAAGKSRGYAPTLGRFGCQGAARQHGVAVLAVDVDVATLGALATFYIVGDFRLVQLWDLSRWSRLPALPRQSKLTWMDVNTSTYTKRNGGHCTELGYRVAEALPEL